MSDFLSESGASILGKLTAFHRHELEHLQRNAWIDQIRYLQKSLGPNLPGSIFFEFFIPRMGKRADCVIVTSGIVFVIEFKVGADTHDRNAIELLSAPNITKHDELHLSVSMRSFRAEKLSAFVSYVLDGDAAAASSMMHGLSDKYPIFLTRDFAYAKM